MIITINDDFDLYKIAYSGQCFRVKLIDDSTYSFVTGCHKVTIAELSDSQYEVSCDKKQWDSIWHHYFDLDTSYADIRKSIPASDTYLKNASDIGKGIRILRQDKFEMLISFIISQRKSIPAIKSCVESLCSMYGQDGFFPTAKELHRATFEELKSCGLGYRVPYITDTVSRIVHKEVDLNALDELNDTELFEALKSFHGVGAKVANCVALFAYHRTSLAPIDIWIQKVIDSEYGGVNPFPNYPEHAGIMQQYMFYAAQHIKNLNNN